VAQQGLQPSPHVAGTGAFYTGRIEGALSCVRVIVCERNYDWKNKVFFDTLSMSHIKEVSMTFELSVK
jgi:hypothetical protein